MTTYATLCYIIKDDKVLLLKKAKGLWGERKWNGPGGKLLPGEDPKQGAIREVFEETGLTVKRLKQQGILNFYFGQKREIGNKERPDWIVHVFSTDSFSGELKPSGEGVLQWHEIEKLPYDEMWEDDRHWVPLLLMGNRFRGDFYFDEKAEKLLTYEIEVIA